MNIGTKDNIWGQSKNAKDSIGEESHLLTQVIAQDQSRFENEDINPMFDGFNYDYRWNKWDNCESRVHIVDWNHCLIQ